MEDTLETVTTRHGLAEKLFYRSLKDVKDCCIRVRSASGAHTFGDPSHPLKAELIVHNQRFFVEQCWAATSA